jgi:hypothetical protein
MAMLLPLLPVIIPMIPDLIGQIQKLIATLESKDLTAEQRAAALAEIRSNLARQQAAIEAYQFKDVPEEPRTH